MADLADSLTASEDERLDQAEALVRSYCGWHLSPPRTEVFQAARVGDDILILPSLYVTAVTSVTIGDTPLVAGRDYAFTRSGVVSFNRRYYGAWAQSSQVEVVFTHGYPDPPADVVAFVQGFAQRAIDNPGALLSRTRGPFTDTYGSAAPDITALSRYRLASRP